MEGKTEYGESWGIAMTLLEKPLTVRVIMEQFYAFSRRFGFFGNIISESMHKRVNFTNWLDDQIEGLIELIQRLRRPAEDSRGQNDEDDEREGKPDEYARARWMFPADDTRATLRCSNCIAACSGNSRTACLDRLLRHPTDSPAKPIPPSGSANLRAEASTA